MFSHSPSDLNPYVIYAGRSQLNGVNPHESSHKVSRVVIPEGYQDPHSGKDMALVQLSSPVSFSDYVHPVCLPASGILFPIGKVCYVTGWGNIRENGKDAYMSCFLINIYFVRGLQPYSYSLYI